MRYCKKCESRIPVRMKVDGKVISLASRKYCLSCSPFGSHNTKQLHLVESIKKCAGCGCEFLTQKQRFCGACNYRRRRDIRREKICEIIGTACWYCGYDKGQIARGVMEFHHIDPTVKLFNISTRETTVLEWEKVVAEIKKCVFLCCRCHREQQVGIISDSDIAELYQAKWIDLESTKNFDDPRPKRSRKARSKKQRPRKFNPTDRELSDLVGKLPLTQIGKLYGVSDNAVRKRCRLLGIVIP